MKMNKKYLKIIGGIFLTLGLLSAYAICGLIIWGDLEASMFTDGIRGDKAIKTLNCPVVITSHEEGIVSAVLKNPTDKNSNRFLRAIISEGYASLVREIKAKVDLPANGKQKVEWKIYPEDAAYKRIVLFQVYVNAKYPYPSMSGHCGIVKVNIPWVSGNQFFALTAAISASFLIAGVVMWEKGIRPASRKTHSKNNAIYFLTGILATTAIVSYLGSWIIGVLGIGIALILTGVILLRC